MGAESPDFALVEVPQWIEYRVITAVLRYCRRILPRSYYFLSTVPQ